MNYRSIEYILPFIPLLPQFIGMTRRTAMSHEPWAVGKTRNAGRETTISQQPLTDQIEKSAEFKRRLALFFIEIGRYKITDKGYEELAPVVFRQNLEFGEPVSDRVREPRLESKRPLTPKEIKETVAAKVEEMIREGKTEELLHEARIIYKADWKEKRTRIKVIKKLLEFLGASPVRLDGLREELSELILKSAREEKTDTKRMQEVLEEIQRNLERVRKITKDDFINNGLGGLLISHYKNSPHSALVEAGYAYSENEIKEHARTGEFGTDKIYPWEHNQTVHKFYKKSEIRVAAIEWLIWRLKKDPKEINTDDFRNNGLGGLLNYYKGSPYLALVEADYAYSENEIKEQNGQFGTDKIYPWEMTSAPNKFYHKKENRVAAVKWLTWKLNKEPREITRMDFIKNGLQGLLDRYDGSPYEALLEASLVAPTDESYMRERGYRNLI